MPDNVARNVTGALGEGNKQHADFVAHRLQSTSVSFHAPIKMNNIHLRGNRHKYRNKSQHVNSTNEDKHLLRQLYMTMYVRERNSDRLLEVENADCPPSLSKHSILSSDQKSDLLSCLEAECPSDFDEADAKLIDGAHMVHLFRPDASFESFRDYADRTAIPSTVVPVMNGHPRDQAKVSVHCRWPLAKYNTNCNSTYYYHHQRYS